MTFSVQDRVAHLGAGELLDIHDGEGLTVRCIDGAVWITQSHDPRDVVLRRGESFMIDRPGLTLVSAPGESAVIAVRAAAARHALTGPPSRPSRTVRPPA